MLCQPWNREWADGGRGRQDDCSQGPQGSLEDVLMELGKEQMEDKIYPAQWQRPSSDSTTTHYARIQRGTGGRGASSSQTRSHTSKSPIGISQDLLGRLLGLARVSFLPASAASQSQASCLELARSSSPGNNPFRCWESLCLPNPVSSRPKETLKTHSLLSSLLPSPFSSQPQRTGGEVGGAGEKGQIQGKQA